jgi:PAS domain S-box-containing protein
VVAVAFALLLAVLTGIQRQYVTEAEASAEWVAHTYAALADLNGTLANLVDAETGQRGFLITGEDRYLEPYRTAAGDADMRIADLASLTADNPDQQRDIALLRTLAREKLDELEQTIAVRRHEGFVVAQRIVLTDRGKAMMDRLRDVTSRMAAREQALLAVRQAHARRSASVARLATFVSVGIATSAVALVWFGYRRFSRERLRAAEAIAAERERLEVTLLGIGDGVIVVDEVGCVTLMNPVAESLTGCTLSTTLGVPVSTVFHIVNEYTRQPVTSPLDKVLETGQSQGLANHTVLIAKDGVERPIDDAAAPLRDAAGGVIGAVLVFRDVSQRRADERRLQSALEDAETNRAIAERRQGEVEAALEVKNEFLAAVSHELRTPINAIVGWARMLHEHTMRPEKVDAAISSIDRSARTLAQLIEDLLESSRLLTGRVRLGSETVDVRALIIDSVETIRLSADNKGLSVEVSAESVPAVCGDGDRLKQAFLNVLVNAVKFTPAGGRVAIRTSPSIDAVEIAISDTGAGIAPAFLPHVFDRFRQADATAGSGLGLGLAIAKQLVELHGGTIEASSEGVGRGATFTIRLPAAAAEVPASR